MTGNGYGNASRRVGTRNPEEAVGEGWREWAVDTGQQSDQSAWEIGSSRSEGRPVKMSQHSSWVVEFSLEIHASVSLHMHRGMQCYITPLLALWVNPSSYCSFVLSSHSLDCLSCSQEEMCDAPFGTTRWSPAKIEVVWRSWCNVGAEWVSSQIK